MEQIHNDIDEEIYSYLNPKSPKSFFLYAGAGSGKTRTLVNVLQLLKKEFGEEYRFTNRKVAVITYTNAARDEIIHRLEYDSIFYVSTIHSFAWDLIKSFTNDIKEWLRNTLAIKREELEAEQSKSKNLKNKTSVDRERKIKNIKKRIEQLKDITKFTYSPDGENSEKESLNHFEVIAISTYMILEKKLMRNIICSKFPIILVDESQDTNSKLIMALFHLQKEKSDCISIGFFGDTMQRIYTDGISNMEANIPFAWEKPAKIVNYRSNKRIIRLINEIRKEVDNQKQIPIFDKEEGFVRLFITKRSEAKNKDQVERNIAVRMAEITNDNKWESINGDVKILILEHHMAALRMGFYEFFEKLYSVDKFKTGLLDGSLPQLNVLTKIVIPLLKAHKSDNKYEIARIVRKDSPLLQRKVLAESENQSDIIRGVNVALKDLFSLWDNFHDPRIIDVISKIHQHSLFNLQDTIKIIVARNNDKEENTDENYQNEEDESDILLNNLDIAFQSPFSQLENYEKYVSENSRFGTHHGVKGLEFPRVMVVIDDEEAKGFLFSYDKLFGVKNPSDTDIKNKEDGKDDSIERTKRLFYVVCSRAKESLALVAYTNDPETLQSNVIKYGWFNKEEVEIID